MVFYENRVLAARRRLLLLVLPQERKLFGDNICTGTLSHLSPLSTPAYTWTSCLACFSQLKGLQADPSSKTHAIIPYYYCQSIKPGTQELIFLISFI